MNPAASSARSVDRSGKSYSLDEVRWCGDDRSPLMITELPGITPDQVDRRSRGLWRYAAALPVEIADPVSLGEGGTPMVPVAFNRLSAEPADGSDRLLVKPEWLNPTASFKDRGSSVMVSFLAQQGIPAVLEDSSGNGGSSVAAYAAAAGLEATILAPESTSSAKLQQARAHGASVELIPGTRQDTADAALAKAEEIFYASHNWHPFFLQGTKLIAYEIWEDLDFTAPDTVVTPLGAGSLVLGLAIGFGELLRAGQIDRLPRILAAQPQNCSPLAKAWASGAEAVAPATWSPTLAEGTAIAQPVRDREVLRAVRESEGAIVAVSEEELAAATRRLSAVGLYAEPTSASTIAGLPQLQQLGVLDPAGVNVVILTGTGNKAAEATGRALGL